LRHYDISEKVVDSTPDKVTGFSIDLMLLVALLPWGWLSF
jgi:hypothetical protein